MEGIVKSFDGTERKGFGFIVADGVKEDIFFHASSVEGMIATGDRVEFDLMEHQKGKRAKCVRPISADA